MNNLEILKVFVVGTDYAYANFITRKFTLVEDIKDANLVIFTGGEDVYPGYYGDNVGSKTQHNKMRDEIESAYFDLAMRYNKLCVGICRGAQFCTVMSGGRLIQHVTNHAISGTHKITIIDENRDIDITSTHHQMMYPFNLDDQEYKIIAKSKCDLSTTYLNGDDEEYSFYKANFVEPEIVYYRKTNCLCIQGHPEYMDKKSQAVMFINVLIDEFLEEGVIIEPKNVQVNNAPQRARRVNPFINIDPEPRFVPINLDEDEDYFRLVARVQQANGPIQFQAPANVPDFFDEGELGELDDLV